MCPKTPKVKPVEEKKPQYMRNPFLDGLALGSNSGRNSLRIELGSTNSKPSVPYQPPPGVVIPNTSNSGLGFGGGTRRTYTP